MSDQGNLRARIENTLAGAGARGKDKAQAIIDEFGLTFETVEGVMDPDGDYDSKRIVGKWEKQ